MKPYGNEHKHFGDELNSTRHGKVSSSNRQSSRRRARKARRMQDKRSMFKESASDAQ